ncbi:YtpI family protein [Brevibacillus sp. SYSU BS000544]|uniref:YtpI family protein n=1 Tax=Brevibacillus sp. SYSU BS000544 TaxID=3416443 RepID=UPI003CE4B6ED
MWFAFYLTGMIASLGGWVYYSVMARRTGIHPYESRMTLGKMNVMLGCLLLLLGSNQLANETLSTARLSVAILFILVGGINFFLGFRNYFRFRSEWRKAIDKKG